MDEGPGPVGVLLLVHPVVSPLQPAGSGRRHAVGHDGVVHQVDLPLGVLAQIHVAEARRGSLLREERVRKEGIKAVGIQAAGAAGVVLRCVQDPVPHEFYVVQHRPAALPLLVVPVDDGALAGGVHAVVVEIAAGAEAAALQLPLQLRPALRQLPVVRQLHVEEIPAALQLRHPRLPEEIQRVHPGDGDVPQALPLLPVPEDPVEGHPRLQLLPPVVGPDSRKVVLGQDHRHHPAQQPGLRLVVRRPGQAGGLRVGVHGVGVLGQQHVHQPGGLGSESRGALLRDVIPVAELPELLVLHDSPLQIGLSGLVAAEGLQGLADLFPPDGRGVVHVSHVRPPLTWFQRYRGGPRNCPVYGTVSLLCWKRVPGGKR